MNRFSTCACTETSSADTGSSATTSCGRSISAPGDRDALTLAAGEHVRIAPVVLAAEADPSPAFSIALPRRRAGFGSLVVDGEGIFPQWRLIFLRGLSEPVGVLGNQLDGAAQPAHRAHRRVDRIDNRRARGFPRSAFRSVLSSGARSVDLPQPDSPTTASVSPAASANEMPPTARSLPRSLKQAPPHLVGALQTAGDHKPRSRRSPSHQGARSAAMRALRPGVAERIVAADAAVHSRAGFSGCVAARRASVA